MTFFTNPTSFQNANPGTALSSFALQSPFTMFKKEPLPPHASHPDFGHLILLVFEAVLEVVCVSLPGYIVARQGMFDADAQKFVANLNVMLFTPCLIFTKLASQLTADKLIELAVIPLIFAAQTLISYLCSIGVSKLFRFNKRQRNFVTAMGVFGNSNSLPISLILSLSQTIQGLHWDQVPGDNDDEVGARGILYLLIFQQLGQLVRWSWGYHVLLAPPESYEEETQHTNSQIEQGQYRDDPFDGSSDTNVDERSPITGIGHSTYEDGEQTPMNHQQYAESISSSRSSVRGTSKHRKGREPFPTPTNGNAILHNDEDDDEHLTSFPSIRSSATPNIEEAPKGIRGATFRTKRGINDSMLKVGRFVSKKSTDFFQSLPKWMQRPLSITYRLAARFFRGVWDFMNPPLWAMLAAIIVASVPDLQRIFFSEGTFVNNSVTRAVSQSGGVAVPLILVVLGANLARNTLPKDPHHSTEDDKEERSLLIASLISRMLLPIIIMAPLLALAAKYVPISILDDPIFVIVCFLLTGAPSALQLAQICQINGVYMGAMSKLLFQSYVVWILPSTLILVMCALEVVEWAQVPA